MIQQFGAILLFYRPLFYWSFAINFLLFFINVHIVPIIIAKLFLVLFLWYLTLETGAKRKLIFYKNLGISTFKLFGFIFMVDVIFTVLFILLMQEFR
jgi:hypothetical protein